MSDIRVKIEEILEANLYPDEYGDEWNYEKAIDQLEALFKERWLELIGKNEEEEFKVFKEFGVTQNLGVKVRNQFREELRQKVSKD